ncbi:uncharacterized protein LOC144130107 [Amblyomma americanum]
MGQPLTFYYASLSDITAACIDPVITSSQPAAFQDLYHSLPSGATVSSTEESGASEAALPDCIKEACHDARGSGRGGNARMRAAHPFVFFIQEHLDLRPLKETKILGHWPRWSWAAKASKALLRFLKTSGLHDRL